jgi:4a-hydroxytetrahydrobiopterin dehydratase
MSKAENAILSRTDLNKVLLELPGWALQGGKLHRDYIFPDFVAAFGFMTGTALIAQSLNHHPEWSNEFNTVHIDLSTHDAGGITGLDVKLADSIEELASRWIPT